MQPVRAPLRAAAISILGSLSAPVICLPYGTRRNCSSSTLRTPTGVRMASTVPPPNRMVTRSPSTVNVPALYGSYCLAAGTSRSDSGAPDGALLARVGRG